MPQGCHFKNLEVAFGPSAGLLLDFDWQGQDKGEAEGLQKPPGYRLWYEHDLFVFVFV